MTRGKSDPCALGPVIGRVTDTTASFLLEAVGFRIERFDKTAPADSGKPRVAQLHGPKVLGSYVGPLWFFWDTC